MKVIYDREKQRVPIKSWCEYPEESALKQAIAIANHPAIVNHMALMPDAHAGMGMPIGGVAALLNAISPNLVGVDIGCGMCAFYTGYKLGKIQGKLLRNIRKDILEAIPVGFQHRDPKWIDRTYPDIINGLDDLDDNYIVNLAADTNGLVDEKKVRAQIGTLGGGNHFIEIQKDQNNGIWVMIHSGSRNVGKQVADLHGKIAIAQCAKWHTMLPDKSLAFLPFDDKLGREYFRAMQFSLAFALANRRVMMMAVAEVFAKNKLPWPENWKGDMINIHHNYASIENHFGKNVIVHRKGATLARTGTVGIIPGSMGTSSYIVKGLGNPDSFMSCSHGAGRTMSRSKAKKTIDITDFRFKMKDIECDATVDHLDEAPQAYKDIDEVMRQQADLVESTVQLSPLAVIKG
jgi:tRNA-splicing ligase RtcB (3'-phosphate/5'-hydroxy nucleic acid ligase)